MLRLTEIKLPLDHPPDALAIAVAKLLRVEGAEIAAVTVFRRGYDARKRSAIVLVYTVDVRLHDRALAEQCLRLKSGQVMRTPDMAYNMVGQAPERFFANPKHQRPVVVGFGPCGMFAALILAQMGLRPIVLERGKAVRERTQDTWQLWRKNTLNPESNVQFGEGGAGTFSDGKLYSQIKDPQHYGRKVLQEFVKAGAPEEILYVSKPHIGTFRLVSIVEKMRHDIEQLGGEIRFQQRVTSVQIDNHAGERALRGLTLANGETIEADYVVLALGHSARDTFAMLHQQGVAMTPKPFSIGVRIEHPQSLIDQVRFGACAGNPLLGAADYRLVHHAQNGRGVYSFCMCPGGQVVAATSEIGRVVTNGMSQYSRSERNANAALVVEVKPEDFPADAALHPLAGIEFQRRWESAAFVAGGEDYSAPAQLVGDFLRGKASSALGQVQPSYQPGIKLGNLAHSLPEFAVTALREAIPKFNLEIPGFAADDALMTGVETRTSSPLRMVREAAGARQGQSINTHGLYPAGEGAGYAGGIYSAAIDGIKIAEALGRSLLQG